MHDDWLAELEGTDLAVPGRYEQFSFGESPDDLAVAARRLAVAAEGIERCLATLSGMMGSSASASMRSGTQSGAANGSAGVSRATTAAIERARRHARTSPK